MNAIDERSKDALFSDLLPYEAWDDTSRMLWLRDGSATQTFLITPKNIVGLTEEDFSYLRSSVTSVLNQIPEGGVLQCLLIREKTSEQSDTASRSWETNHKSDGQAPLWDRLLQAKKEQLSSLWQEGALFQTKIYLTLRISPESQTKPLAKTGPFSQVAFLKRKLTALKHPSQIRQELEGASSGLRLALESQGFEIREVSGKEEINLIYRYLNPERSQALPHHGDPSFEKSLSSELALTDFMETERGLKLGRTPVRVGTLRSFPDSSIPCLLHGLAVIHESRPCRKSSCYSTGALSDERRNFLECFTGSIFTRHHRNLCQWTNLGRSL